MEKRNSRQWLLRALEGKVRYSQLPMIYNGGFIHTSILNEIKDKTGAFFSSVNPDVYTAIAISRLTDEFLFVREPLAISGTSKYSNGHSAFSTSTARDPKAYQQFLSECNIPFHPDIPTLTDGSLPPSLQACVYEAYLQTATLGGNVLGINHAQQLPILLATSGKHRASIDAWGGLFAQLHHLDYAASQRAAAHLRPGLQARALGHKVRRVLRSVVTDKLDLHNVHEASIAAGVIRVGPRRSDSARFLLNELYNKLNRTIE